MQRALIALQTAGDPWSVLSVQSQIGGLGVSSGRPSEALRGLDTVRERAVALGHREAEGRALLHRGLAIARLSATPTPGGRSITSHAPRPIEAAFEALELAADVADQTDDVLLARETTVVRSIVATTLGRHEEALEHIDPLVAMPRAQLGAAWTVAVAVRGAALQALDRRQDASAELVRALEARGQSGGMEHFEIELYLAADACGLDRALERGTARLMARASQFADPQLRKSFLEEIGAHRELLDRARRG
jgi:hypothetical protein